MKPRSSRPRLSALLGALALCAAAGSAAARPERQPGADAAAASGSLVVPLGPGAYVDWTRGLLVATGAAAGDLRAPSPEVARVKAERQARDAARARIKKLARDLALADGRELGEALEGEAGERFDRALADIVDERVDHASDGSVVLVAALPLEAARAAVYGASAPAAPSERGPTAIVVEAGRHLKRPSLGVKLAAGAERYAGPTVFAAKGEELGADRLGERPIRAAATGFRGGALQLGADAATQLAEARAAGALVVVELGKPARDDKGDRDGDASDREDKKDSDKKGRGDRKRDRRDKEKR